MRRVSPIILIIFTVAGMVVGDDGGPALSRQASAGGHRLVVSVGAASISTVDRLDVEVELRSPIGSAEPEFSFNPEQEGWREIDRRSTAYARSPDGDERVRRWTITIEPFLPGAYALPSVELVFADGRTLATESIEIEVQSVLTSPDAGAQQELTTWRDDEPDAAVGEEGSSAKTIALLAAVVVLGGAVLIYRSRRRTASPDARPIDPSELSRAEVVRRIGVEQSLAYLARAADADGRDDLRDEIDHARFAGRPSTEDEVVAIASGFADRGRSEGST